MKKYFYFFLVSMLITNYTFGQMIDQGKITGVYYFPSGNPEGGSSLVVFRDNTFVQAYFGGMINGTWKIENNYVTFQPLVESDSFVVYARKTDTLTTTKISFKRFENGTPPYVNFKTKRNASAKMQKVFNDTANCFSYPYEYELKSKLEEINLAVAIDNWQNDKFHKVTFSVANFNDIIIINNPIKMEARQFTAEIQKNGLHFDGKLISPKGLENVSEDDMLYLKAFVKKRPFEDTIFKNEKAMVVDQIFPIAFEKYTYSKKKDRYTLRDKTKDIKIDENGLEYYQVWDVELFPYKRVKSKEKSQGIIEIQEGSLFTAKCD